MYFGAPFSAPSSIKSKSITKLSEAITTTPRLNRILKVEELLVFKTEIPVPKKLIIKSTIYIKKIPPVAANTPSLKFSVAFIILALYAKSKDNNMQNAFFENIDIHKSTASKIFNTNIENINTNQRRVAKMVNFGIIYGISAFGLSRRLKISKKDANNIIKQYFNEYPEIKNYMDKCINYARKNNYIKTFYGRKRFLKDINSHNETLRSHAERNAINSPIQGTAAEIIKIAMIKINNEIINHNLNSKMILQVHDELVFDVQKSELNIMSEIIKNKMEDFKEFKTPLQVEIGYGQNWLISH